MDYPVIFPLLVTLKGRAPDDVREIARRHGFTQAPGQPSPYRHPRQRGFTEIWTRLAGRGYAVVRIDAQGNANLYGRDGTPNAIGGVAAGAHGGVPHYHKEWIEAELFQSYLVDYAPQVVRYDDSGNPVTGPMNDQKAKQTHIKQ